MKLTYLGTAAAEGMPAVFCDCAYCQEARRLGGKNIRTRSQAMINDDLLLDLPADTYMHFLNNNVRGDKINYLFITHSHMDHFYPNELQMRMDGFSHNRAVPTLKVFCGGKTYEKLSEMIEPHMHCEVILIKPFETVTLDGYTVTALPARHAEGDGALFYLIQGEKTVLYAHDTGYFFEEVFDYLEKQDLVFDLLSMDCTNVDIPIMDHDPHMGIPNIERVVARLTEMGKLRADTAIVINHFSHNANPLHHILEKRVEDLGYLVSYDGMQIDI